LRRDRSRGPQMALMGALIFIFSLLPIPVPISGTCPHPCGTPMASVVIGPAVSALMGGIALLFQALFFAHGGITTWGANVVSMAVVGSFAVRNSVFDVGMMLGFGVLAYVLRKCGFESGPIVLGLLLGPIIEPALITSLTLAQARGSWLEVFFLRPFSALFIVLSVWSLVRGLRGWKLAQQAAAAAEA
ncbi:MAG: energy-coupling factor ABC transporter permease, partial [Armatimonadota bacterium]|nr:energy-coupling factor ABC transporter permease [Armatimonadota bacterium]